MGEPPPPQSMHQKHPLCSGREAANSAVCRNATAVMLRARYARLGRMTGREALEPAQLWRSELCSLPRHRLPKALVRLVAAWSEAREGVIGEFLIVATPGGK